MLGLLALVGGLAPSLPAIAQASAATAPMAAASGCLDVTAWSLGERTNQVLMVSGSFTNLAASDSFASAGVGAFVMYGQPPAGSGPSISSGLATLYNDARAAGHVPPWVSTDEEGGPIARLSNVIGSLPSARQMAAQWTPSQVQSVMASHGAAMWNLGVVMDLAPVLDTANPYNTIADESDRSFSENGQVAANYGIAYARGLLTGREIPVVKHFPGLGHASANTDLGAATDPPLSSLQANDLIPFQQAIGAGLPVVMVSHVSVPGLTGTVPASLSPAAYQYLRDVMSFNGVAMTDSLSAGAVSAAGYTQASASVRALQAGADMVMISDTQWQATVGAIESAVTSGALAENQLDDAVRRILTAKGITVCAPSEAINSANFHSETSFGQYHLAGSDGQSWIPIDPNILSITLTPSAPSTAVLGGNADLWTANTGLNQDIGVAVSANGGPDTLVAWKESGGFGGTFSPNAAYVQGILAMQAGNSYRFDLVWKANHPAGNGTIFAGAGPYNGRYSPTRLTIRVAGGPVDSAATSAQSFLTGSDGQTWQPLQSGPVLTLSPSVTGNELLFANGDLWTENAGYNQDLAIFAILPDGSQQLVAWKESGGFAGTFSPNAAYVQGFLPVVAGQSYRIQLMWKANRPDPGTIVIGAGPIGGSFSPTRLTAEGVSGNAESTTQFRLSASDGITWMPMSAGAPSLSITPAGTAVAVLGANADLWTATAGFNQDLAIAMSVDGGPATVIGWKESGGRSGIFSPNAAFNEAAVIVSPGHRYTFGLEWKTNRPAGGATIYAGAGPLGGQFSPTSLSLQFF